MFKRKIGDDFYGAPDPATRSAQAGQRDPAAINPVWDKDLRAELREEEEFARPDLQAEQDVADDPGFSADSHGSDAVSGTRSDGRPAQPDRLQPWRILLNLFLMLVLAALVVWGIQRLRDPAILPLNSVYIDGSLVQVDARALQSAITTVATGGFLSVDISKVRRAAQDLPWVQKASVRREWPDSLRVAITEQRAVARWGDQGLVNAEGGVFAPPRASYPPNLADLQGPDGTQTIMLASLSTLSKALATVNLHITRLELDQRRAWSITLDNDLHLLLGRDATDARLQRFIKVYPTLLASRADAARTIDLRYNNGFAVRWNDPAQAVAILPTQPIPEKNDVKKD